MVSLRIDVGSGVCQKQNNLGIEEKKGSDPFGFFRLLRDKIEGTTRGDGFPAPESPLEKDRLLELISAIQLKTKDALMHALLEPDENDNFLRLLPDRIRFPGVGVGRKPSVQKIPQVPEKGIAVHSQSGFDSVIDLASRRYGVDRNLIKAVIRAESDFDPNCTSSKGAMGLMQLMPQTAKELSVTDAYNPIENVLGGTRYLKSLLDRYDGSIPTALAAYNWGMGNVERQSRGLPRETRNYIARVTKYYRRANS